MTTVVTTLVTMLAVVVALNVLVVVGASVRLLYLINLRVRPSYRQLKAAPGLDVDEIGRALDGAVRRRRSPDGARQRLGLTLVQPHRAGWVASVAEDWKSDLPQVRRVAVHTPHHDADKARRLGLQHRQVADTGLVRPTAIIGDQHVTRFGPVEGLQEDIHAAVVPDRLGTSGDPLAGDDRADPRGCGAQRYVAPDAGIGRQRCG